MTRPRTSTPVTPRASTVTRAGAPRMPWSLLTWGGHRSQYVSNAARADARAAIAETLERWGEISDTPFDKEISS